MIRKQQYDQYSQIGCAGQAQVGARPLALCNARKWWDGEDSGSGSQQVL